MVFINVCFPLQDLHFGPGVSEQLITVTILEDELPEPDETFEIVLASPKQGLQMGTPNKGTLSLHMILCSFFLDYPRIKRVPTFTRVKRYTNLFDIR